MQLPKRRMRKVILCLLVYGLAVESRAAQSEDSVPLFRSSNPFAVKAGFEGVGFDFTLGGRVALGATTFIYHNAAKARILILAKNGTPFIGAGIGSAGGPGGGNKTWTVLLAGWQHDYERVFIQFSVQATIRKSPEYEKSVFPISVEMGWRL